MIYSYPLSEPLYSGCEAFLDGEALPLRIARVSAMPFNRRWPGHQRQIEQSELAPFANFSFDGSARLRVKPDKPFKSVVVRPLSKRITPEIVDGGAEFTISQSGGYTVEFDGWANAVHLFADSEAQARACSEFDSSSPDTLYFGPGVHRPGKITLTSGQTLVIDEGAVVHGYVRVENARGVKILGRGLLDGSENREEILFEMKELGDGQTDVCNSRREHTITLVNCEDVCIRGITIRDSLCYNVSAHGCDGCEVDDIKIIGSWRYNSDGIDFHNSSRIRIHDCFLRTFDDGICVKGHDGFAQLCEDIVAERCVVWCDWDHALEIGAETRVEHISGIAFRDCDVIHIRGTAISICNVDYGDVRDVLYSDIRVEYDENEPCMRMQSRDDEPYDPGLGSGNMSELVGFRILKHYEYSSGLPKRGRIRRITLKNISVFAPKLPPIRFRGYDAEHLVEDVAFDGLTLNGEPVPAVCELKLARNISNL